MTSRNFGKVGKKAKLPNMDLNNHVKKAMTQALKKMGCSDQTWGRRGGKKTPPLDVAKFFKDKEKEK